MAKMNASSPKPVVPGRAGSSNSTDKMASKSKMTFAVSSDKGKPAQYAADGAMEPKAFFGSKDGE